MNKHYTHLELQTVRRAVESISRLPGKPLTDLNKGADDPVGCWFDSSAVHASMSTTYKDPSQGATATSRPLFER